ncbi:MAG TPA: hypothetical protein VMX17_11070 [Candidatus Glassbacteria bacterium]|nr:hypothetical protein [Candidatus Glassbacteria bacterium]
MSLTKKPPRKSDYCMICNKRKRRTGSLFCLTCSYKDIFVKIKALRDSPEYKQGWIGCGPYNYGRLPNR